MESQWFKELDNLLRKEWVSITYRRRVLGELSDHAQDVFEAKADNELTETNERLSKRLGETTDIAESLVDSYRRRTFGGRHPLLVFGLSPLILGPLGWALFWVLQIYSVAFLGFLNDQPFREIVREIPQFYWIIFMNFSPLPVVIFYLWLAIRCGRSGRILIWSLIPLSTFFCCIVMNSPGATGSQNSGLVLSLSRLTPDLWRASIIILTVLAFVGIAFKTRIGPKFQDQKVF